MQYLCKVLRQLGVVGLVGLLLFQTVDSSITVLYYTVYKKSITQLFCINKAKPEMQCHGKCYLKAKLAEQEEQEESPVFNFDNNTIKWATELWSDLLAKEPYKKGIEINIPYLLSFDIPFHTEIFHPPQTT